MAVVTGGVGIGLALARCAEEDAGGADVRPVAEQAAAELAAPH